MAKPTPFFSFTCPSCGAPGGAYSATSVLLVCEYCHSMLERFGGGLESTGKKSVLLEDFSPIQLYTSGTYQGDPFTVIGVLQIQYERGFWKEWYILFADGTSGWLGDFSGQYVITRQTPSLKASPPFDALRVAQTNVLVGNAKFVACDVREATSLKTYARGELPFTLKENEKVLGADFRYRNLFMTLDYSEDEKKPQVYQGKVVELKNLHCQNLRTDEEIKSSAGRLKGERVSLNCPQCGAPLAWYPGVASNIICQNCQSHVNFDSGLADLTKTHKRRLAQQEISTLKLGDTARILGERWTIIGMARIHELPPASALMHLQGEKTSKIYENSYWHEYLLYNVKKGFFWLVESSDGSWDQSHAPHTWPELQGEQCIDPASNKSLRRLYAYGGEVIYAAGAFYWNIEPGDITYYQDFQIDNGKFSAELTREELNWSLSKPVTGEELANWFKRPELATVVSNQSSDHPNLFLGWVMFGIYAL
ncbi:MAG: DUF4178 domain-containing protein, partial [Saezia sp.]